MPFSPQLMSALVSYVKSQRPVSSFISEAAQLLGRPLAIDDIPDAAILGARGGFGKDLEIFSRSAAAELARQAPTPQTPRFDPIAHTPWPEYLPIAGEPANPRRAGIRFDNQDAARGATVEDLLLPALGTRFQPQSLAGITNIKQGPRKRKAKAEMAKNVQAMDEDTTVVVGPEGFPIVASATGAGLAADAGERFFQYGKIEPDRLQDLQDMLTKPGTWKNETIAMREGTPEFAEPVNPFKLLGEENAVRNEAISQTRELENAGSRWALEDVLQQGNAISDENLAAWAARDATDQLRDLRAYEAELRGLPTRQRPQAPHRAVDR
jgi:hypothetical protein